MSSVLITGCDTGIGRHFATQYAGGGHVVLSGMRRIIHRIGNHETGQFYDHTGQMIPW